MFFASAERIKAMRTLIGAAELARGEEGEGGDEEDDVDDAAKKKKAAAAAARSAAAASALADLKAYQREDFAGIFRAMRGLPVVIRCLDPPLHEFLPVSFGRLEVVFFVAVLFCEERREPKEGKKNSHFLPFFHLEKKNRPRDRRSTSSSRPSRHCCRSRATPSTRKSRRSTRRTR